MATCRNCGKAIFRPREVWLHGDTMPGCGTVAEPGGSSLTQTDVWVQMLACLERIAAAAERLATPFASFEGTEEE